MARLSCGYMSLELVHSKTEGRHPRAPHSRVLAEEDSRADQNLNEGHDSSFHVLGLAIGGWVRR